MEGLTVRGNSRFSVLVHGRAAMALLPLDHRCEAELAQLEGGEAVQLECEAGAGPGWIADVRAIARPHPATLQATGPAARIARWLCVGACVPRASLGVPGGLRQAGGPSWSDLPLDPAAPAAAAPSRPSGSVNFSRSLFRPFLAVAASTSGPAQDRLSPSTAMLGLLRPRAEPDRGLIAEP
uniref:Uncharacterized protein n=1 Tax=Cryptomonas curvata TaxID=233186 RepID=A0A7S0M7J9_9CRYP